MGPGLRRDDGKSGDDWGRFFLPAGHFIGERPLTMDSRPVIIPRWQEASFGSQDTRDSASRWQKGAFGARKALDSRGNSKLPPTERKNPRSES